MTRFSGPLMSTAALLDVAEDTNSSHRPGEIIFTNDGRAFRWAEAGGSTLDPGKLQNSEAEDTGEQDLTPAATAIGAFTLTTSSTVTVVADEYSWGFVVVTVTPGVGKTYGIATHPAATGAVVTLQLDDPIAVALTTTSRIDIVANPYLNVVVSPTSATGAPVGVAYVALTTGQFGWLQVKGPGVVWADASGAVTVGLAVTKSNQTAGAVEDADSYTQTIVGTAITGIAQAEYGLCQLNLA